MSRYHIESVVVGLLEENCWIITDRRTNHCVVIDPGDEANRIFAALEGKVLDGIVLTHAHFDHVGAADEVADDASCYVLLNKDDVVLLKQVAEDGRRYMLDVKAPLIDLTFGDGEVLKLGDFRFTVLATPGHTPGSSCLMLVDPETGEQHLFSGDTLFRRDVGRTDFPESVPDSMPASLARLAKLDRAVNVYPGHGSTTSIAEELDDATWLKQ